MFGTFLFRTFHLKSDILVTLQLCEWTAKSFTGKIEKH